MRLQAEEEHRIVVEKRAKHWDATIEADRIKLQSRPSSSFLSKKEEVLEERLKVMEQNRDIELAAANQKPKWMLEPAADVEDLKIEISKYWDDRIVKEKK